MFAKSLVTLILTSLLLGSMTARGESSYVEVQGLLGDSAILLIDGERHRLEVGQTASGVTLLSTSSSSAILDINGRRETRDLSGRAGTIFEIPPEKLVTIARDGNHQYQTTALINGLGAQVLVDTGANVVAMSSAAAMALGLEYKNGRRGRVETASGVVSSWNITLRSVSVGGITVDNVRASVVDGSYPATILLGMSYLRHVKLEEDNGILSLSRSH